MSTVDYSFLAGAKVTKNSSSKNFSYETIFSNSEKLVSVYPFLKTENEQRCRTIFRNGAMEESLQKALSFKPEQLKVFISLLVSDINEFDKYKKRLKQKDLIDKIRIKIATIK